MFLFCLSVPSISFIGDSLSTVEMFDPMVGRWRMAEPMSMLRSRVGVAVIKNKLYAFGGYNGTERLSTVEVFDPVKRVWFKVSPMHCKRRFSIFYVSSIYSSKRNPSFCSSAWHDFDKDFSYILWSFPAASPLLSLDSLRLSYTQSYLVWFSTKSLFFVFSNVPRNISFLFFSLSLWSVGIYPVRNFLH